MTRRGFVRGAAAAGLAVPALIRQPRTLDVVYAAQDEAIPQGGAFAAGHQTSILSDPPRLASRKSAQFATA